MISKRMRGILFALFLQLAIWSLSTSLPDNAVLSYPWDDDDGIDRYWYRRSTTRKGRYIRTTTRRVRHTTRRERYTTPYDDYKYKYNSSSIDPMYWGIIGGSVLLVGLVLLLKYLCSIKDDSTYESSPTLHVPPSRIIPPPNPATEPTHNITEHHHARNSNTAYGGGIFDTSASNNPGVWTPGDRPPDYSEVVMGDFSDGNTKFPEVAPKSLGTPPPKYDFGNLPKY